MTGSPARILRLSRIFDGMIIWTALALTMAFFQVWTIHDADTAIFWSDWAFIATYWGLANRIPKPLADG